MWLKKLVMALLFCVGINSISTCWAAEPEVAEIKAQVSVAFKYLTFLPKDYEKQEKWPLVLFLHGAGERGNNLEKVKVHGPPMLAAAGKEFPFILVAPQCPANHWWYPNELSAFLDQIEQKYNVDSNRIYVTGLSMGGYGTWSLAAYSPKRFAAIAPICGGGVPYQAMSYPHLPVWAFHGDKDGVVTLRNSAEIVERLKSAKSAVKFTIYPGVGHNSWTETYNNPELYKWLLEQKK